MLTIFAVIAGGIILGRILCNRNLSYLPRIITFIIWALLLLLGIEVGSNPEVIKGIGTLGLTAFLIFLFSVAGSIIASWLLWCIIRRTSPTKKSV